MKKIYFLLTLFFTALAYKISYATDIAYDVRKVEANRSNENGGLLELGAGLAYIDIPILGLIEDQSKEVRLALLINGSYQKNGFFIEAFSDSYSGLNIGYNAFNSENWSVDIIGSQQNGEISADIDDEITGLRDRDGDFTVGIRASGYFGQGLAQFELLQDIDSHEGLIANMSLGSNWQVRNWNFFAILSARYQSDDMVNYYFGISEDEAANTRFTQYQAGSGIFYTGEIGFMYPLNEKWVMQFDTFYGALPSAIADSPLATDDDVSVTALSFRYVF